MDKRRIAWIDIAKAATIITVIVGHSVSGLVCGVIYSFHMVLFFFVSAWTSKYADDKTQLLANLKKGFKHLIVPTFIVF